MIYIELTKKKLFNSSDYKYIYLQTILINLIGINLYIYCAFFYYKNITGLPNLL